MQDMDKIIDELTLMLLYLTSWQECPTEEIRHKPIRTAEKLRLTWKGHDRSALSRLDAAGLPSEKLKSVTIMVSTIPFLCLYPFIQKYFVRGVMVGSIKG